MGGGPETGAVSDKIITPNSWGVLHLTFLVHPPGKSLESLKGNFSWVRNLSLESNRRVPWNSPNHSSSIEITWHISSTQRLNFCATACSPSWDYRPIARHRDHHERDRRLDMHPSSCPSNRLCQCAWTTLHKLTLLISFETWTNFDDFMLGKSERLQRVELLWAPAFGIEWPAALCRQYWLSRNRVR